MTSTWNKAKQFLAPSIKILVLIGCITLLYFQWQDSPVRMDSVLTYLQDIPFYSIISMLLLSLGSWLVESKKWQLLVQDVEEIRFRESVIQSLTAQAASFITPLRAGEFIYKSLFYDKSHRKTILSRVFIGNMSQMLITILLGFIGLSYFIESDIDSYLFFILLIGLVFSILYITYLWILNKWRLKNINRKIWIQALLLSLVRYIFFASNWLLILYFLKKDTSILIWINKIFVNYLAVSLIPMFQIFDIPVKWVTASYIFNGSNYKSDYIIFATTIVWCTNTLFPTLCGWVMIPFKKLKKI